MYEKSEQLTGNSISRLVETQRKENPYKIYETNDIRQSQNVIFRYPYLMEKSTEKIKDDSRSEKGSEKPLPRTQQRKKIFEAKSTLQSQMKQSTLSMDRNRTNSANSYDKNPVRQKIKNSSNKSYGRRVSQQSSFTHSVTTAGQPVIFNYQSPQGPLFHPTVTLGQKSQVGSKYPLGVVNYSSMPIQKIPQKISLSTYPSPIFESRATQMPMKTSNIYPTQQETKFNPIIAQSYIHPIGKVQPSQALSFPPGYPPVHISPNFQQNPSFQPLPPHKPILQQKGSPQQSPGQIKNHSPIKIKNIKNILSQNPNISLQQFQPKCVNSPNIPKSLTNSSNLRETSQQNQIKNIKHVHYQDDVQKEQKNWHRQGRKLEEKHSNNGGMVIHGHGDHFPVQAFQHQPPSRNMYETYKSGQRFMKNNHPKILNHASIQQAQIRKKAPSITSFASNANLQQPVQYSIDLKQGQEAQNLDQHNQPQYSDRFFDMEIKNSVHHDQHKTHKHFHKVPQVKKHFSEDSNKSPESSPPHYHQHHKIHQKDSLKTSQNLNLESPLKKQKKTSSSSYNQSKVEETSAQLQKNQAKNRQTLIQKYNNQGNLTIFFLIFLGFLLVLLQAIK